MWIKEHLTPRGPLNRSEVMHMHNQNFSFKLWQQTPINTTGPEAIQAIRSTDPNVAETLCSATGYGNQKTIGETELKEKTPFQQGQIHKLVPNPMTTPNPDT